MNESISNHYLVPAELFESSLAFSDASELVGSSIKTTATYETQKDILEVSDYEPEMYKGTIYKSICFKQQIYTTNKDGHQLRTNVLGRAKLYQAGRLSLWEIRQSSPNATPQKSTDSKIFIENRDIKPENECTAFTDSERAKLVETIDAFIRSNSYASNFTDVVTDDIAPDYLNVIAVEMNLYTIRDGIENNHYRSKEMLISDLNLIEINCVEFNGIENPITKQAKQVHTNLKKSFERVFQGTDRPLRSGAAAGLRSIQSSNTSQQQNLRRAQTTNNNARNRITSTSSEQSDRRQNKRVVQKTTSRPLRNTRARNEINYNENALEERKFKKPTPPKYRKVSEDDSEISHSRNIDLRSSENSTNLRRSTRSRNQVTYKEPEEAKTPTESRASRTTRRRDQKANKKESESFDYNREVTRIESKRTTRRSVAEPQVLNGKYRRKVVKSNDEDDFSEHDDEDEFDPDEY